MWSGYVDLRKEAESKKALWGLNPKCFLRISVVVGAGLHADISGCARFLKKRTQRTLNPVNPAPLAPYSKTGHLRLHSAGMGMSSFQHFLYWRVQKPLGSMCPNRIRAKGSSKRVLHGYHDGLRYTAPCAQILVLDTLDP